MALKFESHYRATRLDGLMARSNAVYQDVDIRLHRLEVAGADADEAVSAIIARGTVAIAENIAPLVAEAQALLDGVAGGVSADLVQETPARRFTNNTEIVALQAAIDANQTALATKANAASLGAHTGATGNPHQVTAEQVGAYTKAESDAALQDFANATAALNHTHTTADLPMAAPADLTADPPPQNKIPSLADVRDLSAGLPYRRGDVALLPRLDGVPQGWTSMERFSVLLVSGIFSFPINMNDAWRAIVGSKLVVPTRYTAAQSGDAGYVVDLDTGLITVMAEPADRRLNPLLVPLSDTELLIAGGWRTGTQTLLASSEIYNVATNSYTPSTNLPVTLAESVGCLLPGGDVVAAGGRRSHSSTLNHHFFRRDAASGAWTQMTQTPEPFQHSNYRGAGILQLPSGKVLLTGGGSMEASLFDPVANTCVRVADCPFMAFGTKKLRVNGADWHLFGGAAYDEPTDSWFRSFISTPMMSSPLDDAGRFYGDASLNVNMAINSQYVVKD